jgi:hypothetical protein
MAIEQIHGLKFLNREEIAELIAQNAADERQLCYSAQPLTSGRPGMESRERQRYLRI